MARKAVSKSLKTEAEQAQETEKVHSGDPLRFSPVDVDSADPLRVSPVAWGRPRQFISPVGPFSRSLFFKLVRERAFITKNVRVGEGDRVIKLVNVASVDAYLNRLPPATQKRPPHQLVRKRRSKKPAWKL
jgi:hypothetical protein